MINFSENHFFHHKNRFFLMSKQLFTVIVFFRPETGIKPRKYRNVSNVENMAKFALKSGAWYMNLYDKIEGKFSTRVYV
jgi:hypothetical protein